MGTLKEYFQNSSFHGLHYLVNPGLHWTERTFWLIAILSCWGGSVYLMNSWLQFAYENPVSLVVDADYLYWKTAAPAFVICDTNSKRLLMFPNLVFRDKIKERLFFNYYLSGLLEHNYTTSMYNFRNHRSNCSEMFNYCSWNQQEFNCCKNFTFIETAFGPCFTINSLQTNNEINLFVGTKPSNLVLEFKNPCVNLYAISNEEIVTDNHSPLVSNNDYSTYSEYKLFISLKEVLSDSEIRDVEVSRRKCRFPDENFLNVAKKYSYEGCKLNCQKQVHLSMFNCTHHYMPNIKPEQACTEDNLYKLVKKSQTWRQEIKKICKCDMSCNAINVLNIGKTLIKNKRTVKLMKNDSLSHILINVAATHNKVLRKRARSMLDNIVNLGGTASLFVGASLLSIVEIFYYFTIRALFSKIMEVRKKQKKNQITVYPFVN